MKVTRYFQSCLLIEESGARVLVDPSAQEADRRQSLGKLDAVIYTHQHADHFDADLAEKFKAGGATLYANASTSEQMKSQPTAVENGKEFSVKNIKIRPIELPHCLMWDGSEGPQNTGYLFNEMLFHAGDGKELENFNVQCLALPITGPDISLKDANLFVLQVSAESVIPIHYDYIGTKPEVFANIVKDEIKVHVLGIGESVEI